MAPSLPEIDRGFPVEDRRIDWGVLPEEAVALLGLDQPLAASHGQSLVAPCRHAFSLPTLSMQMVAPRSDRPITSVSYEFRPEGIGGERYRYPRYLAEWFGPPAYVNTMSELAAAENPGLVDSYSRWDGEAASVSLSIYGMPREMHGGLSAGAMWLTWDSDRAARPFVPQWIAASQRLALLAREARCELFSSRLPQRSRFPYYEKCSRASYLALNNPAILDTPPSIASRLGERDFAIWTAERGDRVHLSTRWDTLPVEGTEIIDWIDLKPAKGGGYAAIEASGWTVMDQTGSMEIKRAVDLLRNVPAIKIHHHEGYDC